MHYLNWIIKSVLLIILFAYNGSMAQRAVITPPEPPQNLTATTGDHQINLVWNPNSEPDVEFYNVYRDTQTEPMQLIAQATHPDTFYADISIEMNQTYYYRITAVDTAVNESGYSNEVNAIFEYGIISHDSTWTMANSPYIIIEDIIVENGATLTIESGVEVRFDGLYRMDVLGTLLAVGSATDPIIFTSNHGSPGSGDWLSINLINSVESIIQNCIIEYGSGSETGYMYYGVISCDNSSPEISNNLIQWNERWGIVCHNSSDPLIMHNFIQFNGWEGLKIHNNSSPLVQSNRIMENGILGGSESENTAGIIVNSGGNPSFVNNIIYNHPGPGVIGFDGISSTIFTHNTIFGNSVGVTVEDANINVKNCIIWGNTVSIDTLSTASLAVEFSNVQGGWTGVGNINVAPLFVNEEIGDFHLMDSSRCIGAGDPASAFDTDIEGNPRPNPPGSNPDLGAFEHPLGEPTTRDIMLSASDYHFGEVQLESVKSWSLIVRNDGTQPLSVWRLETYYPDFTASDTTAVILPSDSLEILISVTPSTLSQIQDTLRIFNNDTDAEDQIKEVSLIAIGIDTVSPAAPVYVIAEGALYSIRLSWQSNIEGDIKSYNIYRSIQSPAHSLVSTVLHPDTAFIDSDLVAGQRYYYRITALDTLNNMSVFSQEISTVPKNNTPELTFLTVIRSEQHANVTLQVLFADSDGDALTFDYFYSINNNDWITLNGISDQTTAMDTLSFVWDTYIDLGDGYFDQVWFRVDLSDPYSTVSAVTGTFPVDNHVGFLNIDFSEWTQEMSGNVFIPYQLNDPTGDTYQLIVHFSDNYGESWTPANIQNPLSNIGTEQYSDTLIWRSDQDLPNLDGTVIFAVNPHDGWQTGIGDTVQISLDNQVLPVMISYSPSDTINLNWYTELSFTFSTDIDENSIPDGISISGTDGQYPIDEFEITLDGSNLNITPSPSWIAGDSVQIEISPALKDLRGNPFDGNKNGDPDGVGDQDTLILTTKLLADYDQSGSVEFDDLVEFQQIWWNDTITVYNDIGPAHGIPPYLQVQPDTVIDFEDLMVFAQMWNWSAGFYYQDRLLTKNVIYGDSKADITAHYPERKPGDPDDQLYILLNLDSLMNLGALEFVISYDRTNMEYVNHELQFDNRWIALTNYNQESSTLRFNLADLQKEPRQQGKNPIRVQFRKLADMETELFWKIDLRNRTGTLIAKNAGSYRFHTARPLPGKYALHQNYPNPFNAKTIIRYDLPVDAHVRLIIYDILGREVLTLKNQKEAAGFKSVQWGGLNQSDKKVSAGMYLLMMSTSTPGTGSAFNAIRKLIILK